MPGEEQIKAFWDWFIRHEKELYASRDVDGPRFVELVDRLEALDEHLGLIVFASEDDDEVHVGPRALILTAHGHSDTAEVVEQLVDAAPSIDERWEIIPFCPPEADFATQEYTYEDVTITADDVSFVFYGGTDEGDQDGDNDEDDEDDEDNEDDDDEENEADRPSKVTAAKSRAGETGDSDDDEDGEVNLILRIKGCPAEADDRYLNLAFMLLDAALGERNVIYFVGTVNVLPPEHELFKDGESTLLPASELRNQFSEIFGIEEE